MDVTECLIHHLKSEFKPINWTLLLNEVRLIANTNEDMPTASAEDWRSGLDELITDGRVIDMGESVLIDRDEVQQVEANEAGFLF